MSGTTSGARDIAQTRNDEGAGAYRGHSRGKAAERKHRRENLKEKLKGKNNACTYSRSKVKNPSNNLPLRSDWIGSKIQAATYLFDSIGSGPKSKQCQIHIFLKKVANIPWELCRLPVTLGQIAALPTKVIINFSGGLHVALALNLEWDCGEESFSFVWWTAISLITSQ